MRSACRVIRIVQAAPPSCPIERGIAGPGAGAGTDVKLRGALTAEALVREGRHAQPLDAVGVGGRLHEFCAETNKVTLMYFYVI